jgi:DNA-directed RNA polymerase specialized sigma24 family protein
MNPSEAELHLSRISTLWTIVCQANEQDAAVHAAQSRLLARYGGAVRRYLLAATRDAEAAEELFQEFAVRFLRGGLRGACPERGRFRDYLKGVLIHLAADHHQRAKRKMAQLSPDHPEPAAESLAEQEQMFVAGWRDELLARTWAALEEHERDSGQPFHTVLRFRAEHPEASSQQMAEQLREMLGKELSAAGVRQSLHRARDRFADLLLEEIAQGLQSPTVAELEDELSDLGLLEHCKSALQRWVS